MLQYCGASGAPVVAGHSPTLSWWVQEFHSLCTTLPPPLGCSNPCSHWQCAYARWRGKAARSRQQTKASSYFASHHRDVRRIYHTLVPRSEYLFEGKVCVWHPLWWNFNDGYLNSTLFKLNSAVLCSRRSERIRQLSVATATDARPSPRSLFTLGNLPAELVRGISSQISDSSHITPSLVDYTHQSFLLCSSLHLTVWSPRLLTELQANYTVIWAKGLPSRWTTSCSWCRLQSALYRML